MRKEITTNVTNGKKTDKYNKHHKIQTNNIIVILILNLPTTTIVAQPFNIIKWQLKFNPVA